MDSQIYIYPNDAQVSKQGHIPAVKVTGKKWAMGIQMCVIYIALVC